MMPIGAARGVGEGIVSERWEYRVETVDAWPEDATEAAAAGLDAAVLNGVGGDGWELVAIVPLTGSTDQGNATGTGWLQYVFKRPREFGVGNE